MNYWLPYVLFLASGILATAAQRRYFRELARRELGVESDASIIQEIQRHPLSLANVVASETLRRLRALLSHQTTTRVETLRIMAILSIALSLGCFIWAVTSMAT